MNAMTWVFQITYQQKGKATRPQLHIAHSEKPLEAGYIPNTQEVVYHSLSLPQQYPNILFQQASLVCC